MGKRRNGSEYLEVRLDELRYVTGNPVKPETIVEGDRVMMTDGRKGTVTFRSFVASAEYCRVLVDQPQQTARGHNE